MKMWMTVAACVVMIGVMGACESQRDGGDDMSGRDQAALDAMLPPGLICPPVRSLPGTEGWSLGHGEYRAVRASGDVIVYAEGLAPTPGYDVRLARQDADQSPPHLHLYWKAPPADRMVAQVLTQYQMCVSIPNSGSVATVIVEDDDGVHELKVERVK